MYSGVAMLKPITTAKSDPALARHPVVVFGDLQREVNMLSADVVRLPKSQETYGDSLKVMLDSADRIHQTIRSLIADYKRR